MAETLKDLMGQNSDVAAAKFKDSTLLNIPFATCESLNTSQGKYNQDKKNIVKLGKF